jgi:hypothetical protein
MGEEDVKHTLLKSSEMKKWGAYMWEMVDYAQ